VNIIRHLVTVCQVVDARAGPGTKSMYKIKNRNNKELPEDHSIMKKKHKHKHRKRPSAAQIHSNKAPASPGGCSDDFIGKYHACGICYIMSCQILSLQSDQSICHVPVAGV
jgi:hypothetical protein